MNKNGFKVISINKNFVENLRKFITIKFSKTEIDKMNNDNYFKKKYSTILNRCFSKEIDMQANQANEEAYRIAKKYFNLNGVIPFVDREYFKKIGYPKISFFYRVVRKNKETDIGYPHTDKSFWDIAAKTNITPPFSLCKKRVKIWIPIVGCDKTNSLVMFAGSHKEKSNYKLIKRKNENRYRPMIVIKKNYKKKIPITSENKNSSAVMFDDNLIHAGQLNTTSKLRVSAEFHIIMD